MEKEREVKTIATYYLCDECGGNVLPSEGLAYMSNPPQYPHRCEGCNKEYRFSTTYPFISYRNIEEQPQ